MISTSKILYEACSAQVVLVFITIIVITISLFSKKLLNSIVNKYFNIISAVILFISFASLEAVLLVYVFKFFLYMGWNAVALYLILFLIIISPFVILLYNTINNFPFKDFVDQIGVFQKSAKPTIKK